MKSQRWTCITAMSLLAVAMPASLIAQKTKHGHHQYHHYQLIDMGTLGGPNSYNESNPPENIINARGAATFVVDTSLPDPFPSNCFIDCFVSDSVVSQGGVVTELPALDPGYSSYAAAINARGEVVGVSENGQIDPLTGNFVELAVLWKNGVINWKNGVINLGTLGGTQSVANGINDRGRVAGVALNAVPDPFANSPIFCGTFSQCFLVVPATTEAHAFRWTEAGGMQDLGALGGPDSAASFVNQRGQIAGEFFTSFIPNPSTGVPTLDPFFWENGKMVDIGSLGGTLGIPSWMNNSGQVVGFSNVAQDQSNHAFFWDRHHNPPLMDLGTLGGTYAGANWINDAGEIVGVSNLAGDQTDRAFLWKNGVMTNLGTVAGDPCSGANSINSQDQIVGDGQADCFNEDHAALSENGGPLVDLQTLVLPGSGVTLTNAIFINDQGEIAARGVLSNGDGRAVVLIPCDENHPGVAGCDYSMVDARAAVPQTSPAVLHASTRTLPSTVRRMNRYRIPGLGAPRPE